MQVTDDGKSPSPSDGSDERSSLDEVFHEEQSVVRRNRRRPFFSRFGITFNGLQRRGTVRWDSYTAKRLRSEKPHVQIRRYPHRRENAQCVQWQLPDREESLLSTIGFVDQSQGSASGVSLLLECNGGVENSLSKHRRWAQVEALRDRLSDSAEDSASRDTVLLYEHRGSFFQNRRLTVFEPGAFRNAHPSGRWLMCRSEKSVRHLLSELRELRRARYHSKNNVQNGRASKAERCSIWRRCHRQTRKYVTRKASRQPLALEDQEKEDALEGGIVVVEIQRPPSSTWPAFNEMKRPYWRTRHQPFKCGKGTDRKSKHRRRDLFDRLTGHL